MGIKRIPAKPVSPAEAVPFQKILAPRDLHKFALENKIELVPFDVYGMAKHFGIRVILEPMDSEISGMLEELEAGWIIRVNSLHHPNRRRFTIAHEIAHFCLHRDRHNHFEDRKFFRGIERNYMETEANRFAAQLLMPSGILQDLMDAHKGDLGQIAEIFGVSRQALEYRLDDAEFRLRSHP